MSRYIEGHPTTVSNESVIGAVGAGMVVLGIMTTSIKGLRKLSIKAGARIQLRKNERAKNKALKELARNETLTSALERVSGRLNQATEIEASVEVMNSRLGGSNYKPILEHLGKNILAPMELLLRKTEHQLRKLHDKNSFLHNEGADLDFSSTIGPLAYEMESILVNFFKNKPYKQNGLSFEVVPKRSGNGVYVSYRFNKDASSGVVMLNTHDEAANLLVMASKLLELHLKYLMVETSDYAQSETFWVWDVQDMLGYTIRDIINLVASTIGEHHTKSISGE